MKNPTYKPGDYVYVENVFIGKSERGPMYQYGVAKIIGTHPTAGYEIVFVNEAGKSVGKLYRTSKRNIKRHAIREPVYTYR